MSKRAPKVRDIPDEVREFVMKVLWQACELDGVPYPTWVLNPRHKDRATVRARDWLINKLRTEVVYCTAHRKTLFMVVEPDWEGSWKPASANWIAYILGMDHTAILLALKRIRDRAEDVAEAAEAAARGRQATQRVVTVQKRVDGGSERQ